MTKQWLTRETNRRKRKRIELLEDIYNFLIEHGLTPEQANHMKRYCDKKSDGNYGLSESGFSLELMDLADDAWPDIDRNIRSLLDKLISNDYPQDRYLDSEPMEFDGDIIITDPCYIAKDEDWTEFYDAPFMPKCMMRDTIYGDWSCTTFNLNSDKPFGKFCADAGLVGVFDREEVRKYNPEFESKYGNWCYTVIENFKGTCQFVIRKSRFKYEGKTHYSFDCQVHGHGINKITGEPIDFIGAQTGL